MKSHRTHDAYVVELLKHRQRVRDQNASYIDSLLSGSRRVPHTQRQLGHVHRHGGGNGGGGNAGAGGSGDTGRVERRGKGGRRRRTPGANGTVREAEGEAVRLHPKRRKLRSRRGGRAGGGGTGRLTGGRGPLPKKGKKGRRGDPSPYASTGGTARRGGGGKRRGRGGKGRAGTRLSATDQRRRQAHVEEMRVEYEAEIADLKRQVRTPLVGCVPAWRACLSISVCDDVGGVGDV